MVKNALQAQLLKAGLVDNKKAKKLTKQAQHEQRTGNDHQQTDLKASIEQSQLEKLNKDQQLNAEKQRVLEEKTLKANIIQMIGQHKIKSVDGDIVYQFIDEGKIKKVYLSQQIYNALVNGSLVIAKENEQYAYLPHALATRIDQKMEGFILWNKSEDNQQSTDEDDPYAAYVIPDDLMW
ncbi:DUF2058 domain-containing protein [Acinetobacter sp. MD2(2019)]|uniref:DUF2058 domain-containing protein n=1 Tax=Acinetobacter sp. MD2(2019) TaxID=2605273 RepID=UPI002D1E9062|nr:DUF2058 domain-containing protein [Acinetobacter sp. MD2(2019)]MEB3754252.1 DUF2058 domain-containing protein [Acinetobacter sp. MD2(2019)]